MHIKTVIFDGERGMVVLGDNSDYSTIIGDYGAESMTLDDIENLFSETIKYLYPEYAKYFEKILIYGKVCRDIKGEKNT